MQGNDSIVSSRPDTEIFIVRNSVKPTVTDRQGRDLRPIYDQIREHDQKDRTSKAEALFFILLFLLY